MAEVSERPVLEPQASALTSRPSVATLSTEPSPLASVGIITSEPTGRMVQAMQGLPRQNDPSGRVGLSVTIAMEPEVSQIPGLPETLTNSGTEGSHVHQRLERERTRKDLDELDHEPATTARADTEGKPLMQRSVFEWIHEDVSEVRQRLHQTITATGIAEKYGIPERHLVRYLRSEIKEAEACRTLPFTLMLVLAFSIMAIAHDDAISVRSVEDSLEMDIIERANFAYTGLYKGHKNIDDVNHLADFWSWMRLGLVPLLWHQEKYFDEGYELSPNFTAANVSVPERGFWLHYNRIIGGLRMVQERDHEYENAILEKIRREQGDEPVEQAIAKQKECETLQMLTVLYNAQCVGGLDYDLEPELGLPNERAKHTVDPQREEWFYIHEDTADILDRLAKLELSSWLDRETKKIEINIATYNAEFGIHTLTRINFYFSRGGHIWKLIIPSSQFADWHDRWYYGFYDAIWLFCITYIALAEFAEVYQIVRVRGPIAIFTEYLNPWNLADWLSVFGGIAILLVFVVSISMRERLNELLVMLGDYHWREWDSGAYKETLTEYYTSLTENCNYVRYLRLSLAVYPSFIVIRLFKSFAAQPKLALVTQTLGNAAPDLLHFAIVFFSVFTTFAICGIVLFGKELRAFTTANRAFLSCFRVMLGDIEWEDLSAIGRLEATVWLWFFIIVVTMLMLNMILAIIMDNYEIVKGDTGHAETLVEEAQQWYTRTMGIRRGTYVPLDLVLDAVNFAARQRHLRHRKSDPHLTRLFSNFFEVSKGTEESKETETLPHFLSTQTSTPSLNADGEKLDRSGDVVITVEALIRAVRNFSKKLKLSRSQAIEVIEGAVEDFYARHKEGAELDEVLQLINKVSYRVKKLVKLAKRAHELRDFGPVEELKWFGMEVESYIKDVQEERQKNMQEVERLKMEKKELSERLLRFNPSEVFPSTHAGVDHPAPFSSVSNLRRSSAASISSRSDTETSM